MWNHVTQGGGAVQCVGCVGVRVAMWAVCFAKQMQPENQECSAERGPEFFFFLSHSPKGRCLPLRDSRLHCCPSVTGAGVCVGNG